MAFRSGFRADSLTSPIGDIDAASCRKAAEAASFPRTSSQEGCSSVNGGRRGRTDQELVSGHPGAIDGVPDRSTVAAEGRTSSFEHLSGRRAVSHFSEAIGRKITPFRL